MFRREEKGRKNNLPTESSSIGQSNGLIQAAARPISDLLKIEEDGGRQEARRFDHVGAAAALHPQGDSPDGMALLLLFAAGH